MTDKNFDIPLSVLNAIKEKNKRRQKKENEDRKACEIKIEREQEERKKKEIDLEKRLKNPKYKAWVKQISEWVHSFSCKITCFNGRVVLFEQLDGLELKRTFSVCEFDDGRGDSEINVVYEVQKISEQYPQQEKRICIYSEWYEHEMIECLPPDFLEALISVIRDGKVWEFVKKSI